MLAWLQSNCRYFPLVTSIVVTAFLQNSVKMYTTICKYVLRTYELPKTHARFLLICNHLSGNFVSRGEEHWYFKTTPAHGCCSSHHCSQFRKWAIWWLKKLKRGNIFYIQRKRSKIFRKVLTLYFQKEINETFMVDIQRSVLYITTREIYDEENLEMKENRWWNKKNMKRKKEKNLGRGQNRGQRISGRITTKVARCYKTITIHMKEHLKDKCQRHHK